MHPLNHCTNNTRHTLGLTDVCYFSESWWQPSPVNTHQPYSFSHPILVSWHAPRLPESCECVFLRVVSLKEFCEKEPMSLLGFEVTLA